MSKLCPLRKLIFHDYSKGEEVENFMLCMGNRCMWYIVKNDTGLCALAAINSPEVNSK